MSNTNRLVLVDGYAQIYRGFYAIRDLTNARGEPTNALYAIARFMLRMDEELPCDYGAFVMDKGKPAHRMELLPDYKGTRPPMPDPLRSQIPQIKKWVEAAGWPIMIEEGREADDLMAAVVTERADRETFIVSHDKDLAQLVEPGVSLYVPGKKGIADTLDPDAVEAKFGIPPGSIVDYLAIIGDNVDNIPGIAGVGPKTAVKLLNQFGDIDAMLQNADAISSATLRDKVKASADLLHRNRQLVDLDRTLPADWTGLNMLRRREPDWKALLDMSRDNNFKSLTSTLQKAWDDARNPTLF